MATVAQINAITGLYVAYFNRAPDPLGLQFWIDQLDDGRDFNTIASDFAASQEAIDIYPFLASPDVSSPSAFVTSVYANLFNRVPEKEGLDFWVDVINSGAVAPGDMVEEILLGAQNVIVGGVLVEDATTAANKIDCALEFATLAGDTPGFEFNTTSYNAASAAIDDIDATDASVAAAKVEILNFIGTLADGDVHTLCEQQIVIEGTDVYPTQTVLYWGYNPHGHGETGVDNNDGNDPSGTTADPGTGNDNNLTNEGPFDGGIPVKDLLKYLEDVADLDFSHLEDFDVDKDEALYDLGDLREVELEATGDGGGTLIITWPDGTADDIVVTQEYFGLIHDLIFDEEGNSRLYEKEVAYQVPVQIGEDDSGNPIYMQDANGDNILVDAVIEGDDTIINIPAVLTQSANNGSTKELDFTSEADDIIVAGRLELLHGAYIDGGLGYNKLDIDAKGHFAQPKQLLNIQEICIQNLPNVYTADIDGDQVNVYPDVVGDDDPLYDQGDNDSIIDISRATSLEKLTITQGDFEDIDGQDDPGDLTVTGIRNGVVSELDGYFQSNADIHLNYSKSTGDGIFVRLNNVNIQSELEIAHNSPKLNIESTGGANYINDGNLGEDDGETGHVREMIITGDAHLYIEGNLDSTFSDENAVIIDATANTAGVNLYLTDSEHVTFRGTDADDRFYVVTEPTYTLIDDIADANTGDEWVSMDETVIIEGGEGNNFYEIYTYNAIVTNGDGNNNWEVDFVNGDFTAGDGNNHLEGNVVNLTAVVGDGDNRFDIEAFDSVQTTVFNYLDDEDTVIDLTAGDGANEFNLFVNSDTIFDGDSGGATVYGDGHWLKPAQINITAGDGGNEIFIPALPYGHKYGDYAVGDDYGVLSTVTINTGDGDDHMLVGGSTITINSGGGNDDITLLGIDNDYVTQVSSDSGGTSGEEIVGQVVTLNGGGGTGNGDTVFQLNLSVNGGDPFWFGANLNGVNLGNASAVIAAVEDWVETNYAGVIEINNLGQGAFSVTGAGGNFVELSNVFVGHGTGSPPSTSIETVGLGYGTSAPENTVYNYKGFIPSTYGVELHIDTGFGDANITLGNYNGYIFTYSGQNGAIVAKEGSSITGENITLFVDTHADLRAATLNGINKIVLDDDKFAHTGQGFPEGDTSTTSSASLTLLDTQFAALSQSIFSTQGQTFGAQSVLTLVITGDVVLSDLIDFASWNDSVKLCFVVEDGASLTLSAEELHKYVAPEGIAVDEENGYNDNQIIVTDAGFNFDPFNDQNGGEGAGTVAGDESMQDVQVLFTPDGYSRPSQTPYDATIAINSDETPVVEDIVSPFANNLEITGNADLEIVGRVDLDDDFTIDFTGFKGSFPENADGVEVAMTIYNFQEITADVNNPYSGANNGGSSLTNPYGWGEINGNGTSDEPVRIDVVMQSGTTVGDCDQGIAKGGFSSSGVQQYVLTGFIDDHDYIVPQSGSSSATIVVCDMTEDLEVLGLQNNRNSEVTFQQVNWGTEILMEGDGYANASDQEKNLGDPDLSEVGCVTANYFESGANAVVRITNQGVELGLNEDAEDGYDADGERKLDVAGINVNNADRLLIQVEDGDAVINDVTGVDVERVIVTGPEDVELSIACVGYESPTVDGKGNADKYQGFDADDLKSIDGSGVDGEFKLSFDGSGDDSDAGDDAWGNPLLNYKIVDLSGVTLTAIDAIELAGDYIKLIMTADQLVEYGSIISTTGDNSCLDVVGLSTQALDLTAIDVDTIGFVTLDDAAGSFTLDPSTDFGGAEALVLDAVDSDTTVTMSLDQLQTVSGTAVQTIDGSPTTVSAPFLCFDESGGNDATLILTGVEGDDQVDTTNFVPVDSGDQLTVEIHGSDFIGTPEFAILPDDGVDNDDPSDEVFIHVFLDGGVNDVTDIPLPQILGLDCLTLDGGAVLNITADALAIMMSKDPQEIKVADGGTGTINVVDLSDQPLDLDQLVADNPGLDIGTVWLADTNTDITLHPSTSFGGADELITPTADQNPAVGPGDPLDGIEPTSVTMTQGQFLSLDGPGTISGDSVVNLTGLTNNNDADGDIDVDFDDDLIIDFSSISANVGFLMLLEEQVGGTLETTDVGEVVTFNETAVITSANGDKFTVVLTDGQTIGFSTSDQANASAVVEDLDGSPNNPTAILWTFTDFPVTPIDTSGYDSAINTLYISEDLIDGQNEEDLWTYLPSTIDVEKYNEEGIPDILIAFNRVNIFETLTAIDGVTYDDTREFQTTATLTLQMEGTTNIGDVTIQDTNGEGAFEALRIDSYEDRSSIPDGADNGFPTMPNIIGDITLLAPLDVDDTPLSIDINTDTFYGDDALEAFDIGFNGPDDGGETADGTDGDGSGPGNIDREGVDLEIGTIFLGDPGPFNSAVIDIDAQDFAIGEDTPGGNVTIEGIDMSNPDLTIVELDLFSAYDEGLGVGGVADEVDVVVGGVNWQDEALKMGVDAAGPGDLDLVYYVENHTAVTGDDINPFFIINSEIIINIVGGDNDLCALTAANSTFSADGVYASGPGAIWLTADQIVAIGTNDGSFGSVVDGIADNWVLGPGVNPGDVTLNVKGLSGQLIDLDMIAAAGFNIGKITIDEPGADLDSGTTLGDADQICLNILDDDVTLEMSAEQYNGTKDGTIIELRGPGADDDDVGTVLIDNVSAIEDPATGEATIDVTNVDTTGPNQFFVEDAYNPSTANFGGADTDVSGIGGGDGDTTFSDASILGDFAVSLIDLNSSAPPDELFGQTVRFNNETQAGRIVNVLGADPGVGPDSDSATNADHTAGADDKDETDTNVVWLFDSISGGVDVGGYNPHLGRVWVSDELVDSEGGDVDALFTIPDPDNPGTPLFTLDTDIIKRIETEDLDALLQLNVNLAQRVEVAAFTQIAGAEFEIDDPLQSISTLRIDMGGATNINNLEIDNILGPVDPVNTNFPGDDDFAALLINSLLANHADHYLLPDSWTDAIPLPSHDIYSDSFENNVVGDISSGADRGVLHTITINTFENDITDTIPPAIDESNVNVMGITNEGAQFVAETIYFSDDGDTTAVGGDTGTPGATLNINGDNDVTLKSLDTSDADITSLTVNQTGTHTLTITGGSPAYDGDDVDDTTTSLTLTGTVDNVVTFASTVTTDDDGVPLENDPGGDGVDSVTYNVGSGETLPYSGISGGALELIDVEGYLGTVSLGVMSQFNSEEFTLEAAGAGQVFGCVGRGLDDGVEEVPELSATGTWTVNGTPGAPVKGDTDFGGVNNVDLEIKEVVFNAGGKLSLNDVDICITGDIDMSPLAVADLTVTGTTTIEVKAGGKLTLTVEQVDALGGIVIYGEGTVCVVGESDSSDGSVDTVFGNLQTATVDFSAVTLDAGDTVLEITAEGASSDAGGTNLEDADGVRVAQTIIGSANDDALTIGAGAADADDTIDVIARLGADGGDIGEPNHTRVAGNTPVDATPEVAGDTIVDATSAQVQVEVDSGFDDFTGIETGDVVQVASSTEFFGLTNAGDSFVATDATTNDGTAVLELDDSGAGIDQTLDVSAAGGANGWSLVGSADEDGVTTSTLIGSDQSDNNTIVDGLADSVDGAGDGNDLEEDTHTGNDGDDRFLFNIVSSTVASLDTTVVQVGVDLEEWTATMTYGPGATITLLMDIGGTTPAVVQVTDGIGGADLQTSTTTVATAVAAAVNARADAFATSVGAVITAGAESAGQLDLDTVSGEGGDFTVTDNHDDIGFYSDDPGDADDDRSESILTLSGTVTAGEVYTVSVLLGEGTSYEGTYTVMVADTEQDVIDGLATSLNTNGAIAQTFHTINVGPPLPGDTHQSGAPGALEILVLDLDMENIGPAPGGFVITAAGGTSSVVALSSSSILDGSETSLADADADVVTDFVSGDDLIDFDTLPAGTGGNYSEGAEVADFATALADADTAMDGTNIYYLTSSAAAGEEGLLFYDANADGTADGVVHLIGIDSSSFDDSDIA